MQRELIEGDLITGTVPCSPNWTRAQEHAPAVMTTSISLIITSVPSGHNSPPQFEAAVIADDDPVSGSESSVNLI